MATRRSVGVQVGVGIAGSVLIAGALVTVALHHSHSDSQGTAATSSLGAPAKPSLDAVELNARNWIDANVAHQTPISADAAMSRRLGADGFTALPGLPGGHDWHNDSYLVTTTAMRSAAQGSVAAALAASVPVAVFIGDGDARLVDVRKIDPAGAADLASRVRTDRTRRLEGGASLLRNSRIHADGAAKVVLLAGALDLRAATVLAQLAADAQVQLSGATQDAAEAAAGLPVRTIAVWSPDPSALSATLAALPLAYRPLRMTPVAGGSVQLQWDVAIAPTPSLD
jgi:hypothetical protein